MSNSQDDTKLSDVDHAIALAEAALAHCDRVGLIFPAIDISSALDKLRAERGKLTRS